MGERGNRKDRGRFVAKLKTLAFDIAFLAGIVALAILCDEIKPLRDLDAYLSRPGPVQRGIMGAGIGLAVVGGLLMLGAQFLPAPRRSSPPSDAALDGAAVPIDSREERARLSRSFEAEASAAQVKEAWRRRSWRYDRTWRIFFAMLLGALLVTLGLFGIFLVIAPLAVKVLMAGGLVYFAVRIGWEFWIR